MIVSNYKFSRTYHISKYAEKRGNKARILPIGFRHGRLVVIGYSANKSGRRLHIVKCDCGKIKGLCRTHAETRNSCGCLKNELAKRRNTKHGWYGTPEYRTWSSMKARCRPLGKGRKYYSERGIFVCERWATSFEAFIADMGHRPSEHHSIDRINNDGNYEPGNCRWATLVENNNNKRNNLFIIVDGKSMTVAQWANKTGISRTAILYRIKKGWQHKDIVSTPMSKKHQHFRPQKKRREGS